MLISQEEWLRLEIEQRMLIFGGNISAVASSLKVSRTTVYKIINQTKGN